MFVILKTLLIIWKYMAKVIDYRLQAVGGCCYSLILFTEWLESYDSPHLVILTLFHTTA